MNHGNLVIRNNSRGGIQKPGRGGRGGRGGHGRRGGGSSGGGRFGADGGVGSSGPQIKASGGTNIYLPERTTMIQPPHGTIIKLAAANVAGGATILLPGGRMQTVIGAVGLPVSWTTIPAPSTIVAPSSGPIHLPDSFVSQIPAGSSADLAAGAMIHVEETRDLPTEEDKLNTLEREWALRTAHCLAADIQLSATQGLEVPPRINGAFVVGREGLLLPEPMLLAGPLRIVANMILGGDMPIPTQPNMAQKVIPFNIQGVDGQLFEAGTNTDQSVIVRGASIVAGSVIPAGYIIPASTSLPAGVTIPATSVTPKGSVIPWGTILPMYTRIAAVARFSKGFSHLARLERILSLQAHNESRELI